jgi:toxin CcdB
MAKFDVHRLVQGGRYVLDCQADILSGLNTRFVVPLLPIDEAPKPATRLNPLFEIEGARFVMATQFAATIPAAELKAPILTLKDHAFAIGNALDMLITGF